MPSVFKRTVIGTIGAIVSFLLLLPTKAILVIGSRYNPSRSISRRFVGSPETVRRVRNDISNELTEGARRILEHEEVGHLPISRHHIRSQGLDAIGRTDNYIRSGEVILSLFAAITALLVSYASRNISESDLQREIFLRISSGELLTAVSTISALVGLLVVFLVATRGGVVKLLAYESDEMKPETSEELFMQASWNILVAARPARALMLFYIVWITDAISDQAYDAAMEVFVDAMDPETTKEQSIEENLPNLIGAIFDGLEKSEKQ